VLARHRHGLDEKAGVLVTDNRLSAEAHGLS
jgi:hypothetical protein